MNKANSTFNLHILPVIALILMIAISVTVIQVASAGTTLNQNAIIWKPIASGVEYADQKIIDRPAVSDGHLHIVRIDPARAKLRILMSSALDKKRRTARNWCTEFGMVAVINAGMYSTDLITHIGYMRSGDHVNSARWAKGYNSILVFEPLRSGLPSAQILDSVKDNSKINQDFRSVIQNLRLIKGQSVNVWKEKTKKWSEAAIAIDKQGRVLFLFIRSPLPLYDFNEKLLEMPLDITHAMHVEGGSEASLSICTNTLQIHLSGSYETGFGENDSNFGQWDLPNVIGVMADTK